MCVCVEFYVLKGLSALLTQTKQIYLVKKMLEKESGKRGCDSCILSSLLAAETGV